MLISSSNIFDTKDQVKTQKICVIEQNFLKVMKAIDQWSLSMQTENNSMMISVAK